MLKLENRSKEACDFGRDLWIASQAAICAKKRRSHSYRNPLLEGLRPTLELNTWHHWPGVSCSPLPQGLHQTLLPLQLKLKGLVVRQRRCPGQRASQSSNSATEYWQVVTANGRERAQHRLQFGQKHAHGDQMEVH